MKIGDGRGWVREPPRPQGLGPAEAQDLGYSSQMDTLAMPITPTLRVPLALPYWKEGFHIQLGVGRGQKGRGPQSEPLR